MYYKCGVVTKLEGLLKPQCAYQDEFYSFFIAILVIVFAASFIMRSTSDSVIPGSTSATVGLMGCEQ